MAMAVTMQLFILVDDPVSGRTGVSLSRAEGRWSGAVSTPQGRREPVAIPGGLCLDEAVDHVIVRHRPGTTAARAPQPDPAA